MKTFVQLTLAVTLAATASASSHHHGHRHLHAKKDATNVDKREPEVFTKVVASATAVVYQLGGNVVDPEEAKKGLDNGEYVVVGESTPTYTPPPAPSTTKDLGGQFIESKTTTPPPPPPPTTTSTPPPPPPSPTAKAPVANAAASSDNDNNSSSGTSGADREFPSGKVPCDHFPSDYGAVPLSYLGLGGWLGRQAVQGYPTASFFDNIVSAVTGNHPKPGEMCSYACPPGQQKSQWPEVQGRTGQSVGGIYCNDDGFLELTRPSVKTLCIKGEGGVSIQNDLDGEVCTCRTDYPGYENMNIPACAKPGETIPVTNPSQSGYYQWDKKQTSAQYYINPKGLPADDACVWTSKKYPLSAGNWASVNLGVGKADDGITYISLFRNLPTSSAEPPFNMEILGGNSVCRFENGEWFGGATGCTVGLAPGGSATVRYY